MDRSEFLLELEAQDYLLKEDAKAACAPINKMARELVMVLPANELSNIVLKRIDELKSLAISSMMQGHSLGTTATPSPVVKGIEW